MFKHLVILAAGRSVRMWPLTEYVPKAMALAKEKTLIQITVEKYQKLAMQIHLTVGYKSDILSPHVLGLGVNTLVNTVGQGNSWWIYNTLLSKLDEPVMVLTCDSLMDVNLELLEKNYKQFKEPACMLLPTKPRAGFDGDFIHYKNHLVTALSRKEKSEIYCSGCQVLNPKKILESTKSADDFLEVWTQLIKLEQLYCADFNAENWFTFDTIEQLKLYRASDN